MRAASRNFPDASQVGIGTGVTISNSRMTFTGARGIVLVMYGIRYINGGAVAINAAGVGLTVSFTPVRVKSGAVWFDAVAGRAAIVYLLGFVTDPPEGGTVELITELTAGTVDVLANTCILNVISFPASEGQGPLIAFN